MHKLFHKFFKENKEKTEMLILNAHFYNNTQ